MAPLILTSAFDRALGYATSLHRHQWRKVNRVPYVSHLLAVAALVLEDGGSEAEAIAALLHDAVEDQGGEATLTYIRQEFGEAIASLVEGCTEPPRRPNQPWIPHKQNYLQQMRASGAAVQRIVLADKLHNGQCLLRNLSETGATTWLAFSGSPEHIVWFYQQAAACFLAVKPGWMATMLEQTAQGLAVTLTKIPY